MSKTIFLGDTHGRNIWKQIIAKENPDRVVFIGDYFDSFNITPVEQVHNFEEIIAFKETNVMEVIMLIGNHDFHYNPGGETYSGYNHIVAPVIRLILEENKHHLQMCYQLDNILCSHAGIGYDWLIEQNRYEEGTESVSDFVNGIWKHHPRYFMFNGIDPYGNSLTQTPIWIRPVALMSGNKDTFLKKDYIQIVGHTQVKTIDMGQATGGRYYFIDTLDVGEYLIYENETFKKGEC